MTKEKNIIRSFAVAWNGIFETLAEEPAFKYFVLAAILVIAAMLYFPTSRTEKGLLLTMIFAVLTLELINSVMERFLDFLQPNDDARVRVIKDLLSAIVLIAALGAAAIGILIFWPYLRPFIFR
ncbi:MAG: diacylglycerol kinase [Parcubacteria group bacterium]|nr:diacylglycerol kinase [Parcubacteria group bacterium]